MTRIAFAQRYSLAGTILTEPWAPTGAETYYQRRREWFVACRICLAVQPCATEHDARQAAKRPCPATHCTPPSDATPRTSGALWTAEEDAIVTGHTLEEAARLLPERSYTSVAQRRGTLRREGVTVARPIGIRGGKWTPDEDAVIVAVSDIDDAARQLPHRTRQAIRKRRLRLEAVGVTVTPINHPYMPKNPKPRKATA